MLYGDMLLGTQLSFTFVANIQVAMKKEVGELTSRVAELEAEWKENHEVFVAKEQGYLRQVKDLQQKVFSTLAIHAIDQQ